MTVLAFVFDDASFAEILKDRTMRWLYT